MRGTYRGRHMRTDREINLGIAISALNTVIYDMKKRGVCAGRQRKALAMLQKDLESEKNHKEFQSIFRDFESFTGRRRQQ